MQSYGRIFIAKCLKIFKSRTSKALSCFEFAVSNKNELFLIIFERYLGSNS